jgi:hypothetical protein
VIDSPFADLQKLRAALGGDIIGRNQVLCAGPGHSPRDRSLSVKLTATGFITHSFAGDPWQLCRDHVRERLGLPRWREQPHDLTPFPCADHSQNEAKENVARAKRLWDEGYDPRVPLVIDYLASRMLDLPAELRGNVLRFHPRCSWRINDKVDFIPCLIAAFTSINTDEVTAVHRIRLDQPERWPKTDRKMLGVVVGSAIRLDSPGERLAIAEGLESALAARQLGFGATWALGSARELAPIDGVNELIILGERDEASRKAANACARLWTENGRKVALALPAVGADFNDHVMTVR